MEIKGISNEILEKFYSQEMREDDIQRAEDASSLWAGWIQVCINRGQLSV